MADNCVIFPRKLLKKFILLYRELPCLWDRNCVAYKHKQKRHEAISRLTELVQEYDPSATRVHVLRKIESLRACVRREYKRVRDSRREATKPDEVYVPHLWYYELFSFVFGSDAGGFTTKSHSPDNSIEDSQDDINENGEDDVAPFDQSLESYPIAYNVATNIDDVPDSASVTKGYSFDDDQSKNGKRHCTEIEDEYDAIGINVAAKLRTLPPNMRIMAEKLINDVLYQAQMNGLNSSSVITTTDPFKQVVISSMDSKI
ncbi:uncharacterized protein [Battus philenor]|uniref:uncharacterized protein n=1 Tax=Battus philenor TaxID=42288 RepID=UPI0035D10D9E